MALESAELELAEMAPALAGRELPDLVELRRRWRQGRRRQRSTALPEVCNAWQILHKATWERTRKPIVPMVAESTRRLSNGRAPAFTQQIPWKNSRGKKKKRRFRPVANAIRTAKGRTRQKWL
jgi:hypothetical protein